MNEFPWPYYVDEPSKTVFVYIADPYPTAMALPRYIGRFFPGYKGSLCSENFLLSLKKNEQKEGS